METQLINGSPCPLCGEVAFSLERWSPPLDIADYTCLWDSETAPLAAHLQPCECAACGTVQMVVTRL